MCGHSGLGIVCAACFLGGQRDHARHCQVSMCASFENCESRLDRFGTARKMMAVIPARLELLAFAEECVFAALANRTETIYRPSLCHQRRRLEQSTNCGGTPPGFTSLTGIQKTPKKAA